MLVLEMLKEMEEAVRKVRVNLKYSQTDKISMPIRITNMKGLIFGITYMYRLGPRKVHCNGEVVVN